MVEKGKTPYKINYNSQKINPMEPFIKTMDTYCIKKFHCFVELFIQVLLSLNSELFNDTIPTFYLSPAMIFINKEFLYTFNLYPTCRIIILNSKYYIILFIVLTKIYSTI